MTVWVYVISSSMQFDQNMSRKPQCGQPVGKLVVPVDCKSCNNVYVWKSLWNILNSVFGGPGVTAVTASRPVKELVSHKRSRVK